MPLFLPMVGGVALGSAVGGLVSMGTSAAIGPFLEPREWTNRYDAFARSPVLLPTINELIALHFSGLLGYEALRETMTRHGAASDDSPPDLLLNADLWRRSVEGSRPWLTIAQIMNRYWVDGDEEKRDRNLDRAGLWNHPEREQMAYHWNPISPAECLVLLNRGDVTEEHCRRLLARNGIDRREDQTLALRLRYQMPTHSDLIPFMVREVFDTNVAARFDYDAEFPDVFQQWMDRIGFGWKPSDLGYNVPPNLDLTWPRAFWRAHWHMMSPTAAEHAVHYLRPRAEGAAESRIPGVRAFTHEDFDRVLKIADYPPIIREWLYGLSFRPLRLVDIRRMFRLKVLDRQGVFEAYRDLGYSPDNAENLTRFTEQDANRTNATRDRARTESALRDAFETGLIGEREFAEALYVNRLDDPAAAVAFGRMDEASKQEAVDSDTSVHRVVTTIALRKELRIAKKTIAAVRGAFIRQEITGNDAVQLLQQAGIESEEIVRLTRLWMLEGRVRGKQATVAQILRWLVRGAITPSEAVLRLERLNVPPRDINIMLAIAQQDVALNVAREREKQARTAAEARRAQAAQLREIQRLREKVVASLNKSLSRPGILRFLKSDLITPMEAYRALVLRAIYPIDAYLWVLDVLKAKGEEDSNAAKEVQEQADKDAANRPGTDSSRNGDGGGTPSLP